MKTENCKNCDTHFKGNYCPICAQSINANKRLTFGNVATDFFENIFNLDRGFFHTFLNLLKRPGYVAQIFIDGKRKRLTSPGKYIILATAIQALFEYIFMYENQGVPFRSFSFLSESMNRNMHLWNQIFTLDYPLVFGLVNLLVWPIPLYFLFRKLNYNMTELITSMMYFYGTIVILIELMVMIYSPLTKENIPIELVSLLATTYMVYAFLSFFKKGSISWRIPRIIVALLFLFIFRMFLLPFTMAWLFPIV